MLAGPARALAMLPVVFQHALAAAGDDAAVAPGRRDHQPAFAEGEVSGFWQ